ncbi:MAG: YhjD/YihY/BrkB family envelope integrity protein, partial [Thermoanaerobaculia bacterium]
MIEFLSNIYIFLRELYENFKENKIFEKATSLSYITFIGFFPAMAGVIHIYSLIFKDYEIQIENFFRETFYVNPDQLKDFVLEFLAQTRAFGNVAIIFSFIIAIKLLFSIEGAINSIWSVEKKRSFIQKLSSFTLILFWGPILFGFLNTFYYFLIKNSQFPKILIFILPKLIFFFIFSMVIKIVPMASVSFSSAFF